jgi:hypothetical protein
MATSSNIDDDYSAQADMRTLVEAEAIKRDKKRFAAAKAAAKKRITDMENAFGEEDDKQ